MKEKRELIFDIYEKVNGHSDFDWIEIRDRHNLDCHPDSLRKAGVGIKMAADAGVLNFTEAENNEVNEIFKAKRQLSDQRREYNKLLIDSARKDHLLDELVRIAGEMAKEKPLPRAADSSWVYQLEREGVLVLSDWHYGMTVSNVWNRYDTEIADLRIMMLRDAVIEKIKRNGVGKLHIVILGDMVNGAIHCTSRVKSSEDTVDQLMHVSERLAELISEISCYVDETLVYCTYGNHGRVVQNYKDSIHTDNLEKIIPFWMKERLKDRDDIVFVNENAHELLRIRPCGFEVGAVHGDLDDGKNISLEIVQLYQQVFGAQMRYLISGHVHNTFSTEQSGVRRIGIGSLCGTDEYAKNKRLLSSPSQTFLIYDGNGLDSIHVVDLTT